MSSAGRQTHYVLPHYHYDLRKKKSLPEHGSTIENELSWLKNPLGTLRYALKALICANIVSLACECNSILD